ncbi:MAG: hypothetical protein V1915_04050 [Candidatus Bathyarchaeota archaeon]
MPKEIINQTQDQFKKRRENSNLKHSAKKIGEGTPEPLKTFEPTPRYSEVFSEKVGKKTRPNINIDLKNNPRIIALRRKDSQESKENKNEKSAQGTPPKSGQEQLNTYEPTPDFYKIFSGIIGKNNRK